MTMAQTRKIRSNINVSTKGDEDDRGSGRATSVATKIEITPDGQVKIEGNNINPNDAYLLVQQAMDNATLIARSKPKTSQPVTVNINCSDGAAMVIALCALSLMLLSLVGSITQRSNQYQYRSHHGVTHNG